MYNRYVENIRTLSMNKKIYKDNYKKNSNNTSYI